MTFIKNNLRWPGGKSRMMHQLEPYVPGNISKYIEVFVGGGGVLLYMLQNRKIKTAYANDIDANLINYYDAVQRDPIGLINEILTIKKTIPQILFLQNIRT